MVSLFTSAHIKKRVQMKHRIASTKRGVSFTKRLYLTKHYVLQWLIVLQEDIGNIKVIKVGWIQQNNWLLFM